WKRPGPPTTAGVPIAATGVTATGGSQAPPPGERIPFPKIPADDSHLDAEFGRAWIEVEATRAPDATLRAIKAGDFRLGFAPEPAPRRGRGFDPLALG